MIILVCKLHAASYLCGVKLHALHVVRHRPFGCDHRVAQGGQCAAVQVYLEGEALWLVCFARVERDG